MKLEALDVSVTYGNTRAVRGVSLSIDTGERVGLIGESGSGKSSLARALLGLQPLSGGSVRFNGQAMHGAPKSVRRQLQPVFQDVGAALDPRHRIRQVLAEPFEIHDRPYDDGVLTALLAQVQLPAELLGRLPRELSVGQRQRVNLARALALEPSHLVLDEPVSALDVSVQAQVINLLNELAKARGLAWLVITHDLEVVAHLCTRIAVMYAGAVVEQGPRDELLERPRHPYTRMLVESHRRLGEGQGADAGPTARSPSGCPWAPHCSSAIARCRTEEPRLSGSLHQSACFVSGGD